MEHVQALHETIDSPASHAQGSDNHKSLLTRATGRFYTPHVIGARLAELTARRLVRHPNLDSNRFRLIDPFGGDGRLIEWLLQSLYRLHAIRGCPFSGITIWDCDESVLEIAERRIADTLQSQGWTAEISTECVDTFVAAPADFGAFDCVITNPPWESLKPDRRELSQLSPSNRQAYIDLIRERDNYLTHSFPLSQPRRKFSGWGTNLSRVGTEVAMKLATADGIIAVVTPGSLFGDQNSDNLRAHLLTTYSLNNIDHYPAEARLFANVDSPTIGFLATNKTPKRGVTPRIRTFDKNVNIASDAVTRVRKSFLNRHGWCIPLGSGIDGMHVLNFLSGHPQFRDLERNDRYTIWAGRELDETNHRRFIGPEGRQPFIKGRMVGRFSVKPDPKLKVSQRKERLPKSVNYDRIAWRDVSRPSQKRRMQAAVIPAGSVTGNSLHVAYCANASTIDTYSLMGLLNSLVCEFQVRSFLMTGHMSLGVVRRCHIPPPDFIFNSRLGEIARSLQDGSAPVSAFDELEVVAAQLYGLSHDMFASVLSAFPKLGDDYRQRLLDHPLWANHGTKT